jgi:hypothetical protein
MLSLIHTLWRIGVDSETQHTNTTTTYYVPQGWLQLLLASFPAAIVLASFLVG